MTALEILRAGGDFSQYARLSDKPRSSPEELRCAHDLAVRSAHVVRKNFGDVRLVLFGSLAREHYFDANSDIDLMVWGLSDMEFSQAIACLEEVSPYRAITLHQGEIASPRMLKEVARDGVEL